MIMPENYFQHHGIKGMHWGVRRYQNADGTLTEAGQQRYDRDKRENDAKKKDNRIKIDKPDPQRWVKEDLSRSKQLVDSTASLTKQVQEVEKMTRKPMDLSSMSDEELRTAIQRESLEQQYNKLFSDVKTANANKARQYVNDTLTTTVTLLGITSSALAIAKSIKDLKG